MSGDWIDDFELHETTPPEGGESFCFWWEDMRPREVRLLVQDAYERGRLAMREQCAKVADDYERVERETSEFYRARGRPDRVEMHDARAFVLEGVAARCRRLPARGCE